MRTSEKFEEILKAIAKIQHEMPPINKSGKNTFFKPKDHPDGTPYMMLEDILEASKPLEKTNGVSVLHYTRPDGDRIFGVTRLFHTSGEWAEIEIPLLISKNDMQGLKSAMTYSKRANLEGFYNIEPEFDDDGNKAAEAKRLEEEAKKKPPSPPKQTKHFEKAPYIFDGGIYQGQNFKDVPPKGFDAELEKYKAVNPKTPKLGNLINRMEQFKQEQGK